MPCPFHEKLSNRNSIARSGLYTLTLCYISEHVYEIVYIVHCTHILLFSVKYFFYLPLHTYHVGLCFISDHFATNLTNCISFGLENLQSNKNFYVTFLHLFRNLYGALWPQSTQ